MNKKELRKILDEHQNWLLDNNNGTRANLRDANLTGADLTGANLRGANLRDANLTGANLRDANLTGAYLTGANLRDANLTGADLRDAYLTRANLTGANLTGANLRDANLRDAYLTGANLRDANLTGADLTGANLTGSKGIKTAKEFLSQFERTEQGIYVFKTFGAYQSPPNYWKIESNAFIEEVVNSDRCTVCGSGVNFATLDWIKNDHGNNNLPVWKCLIHWEDMADVVVPYNTDGKARCARLQLIEVVDEQHKS